MSDLVDLSAYTQAVFTAESLLEKRTAMLALIKVSRAKKETKIKAERETLRLTNPARIDSYAFNYMASGEGLKVS